MAFFFALYGYAGRRAPELRLNAAEQYATRTIQAIWAGSAVVGLLAAAMSLALPDSWVPFAGFTYLLLGIFPPLIELVRHRSNDRPVAP